MRGKKKRGERKKINKTCSSNMRGKKKRGERKKINKTCSSNMSYHGKEERERIEERRRKKR
jgi:hypothetical protein